MLIRKGAVTALMLAAAGEVGCSAAPKPPAPVTLGAPRLAGRARRKLSIAKPTAAPRTAEQEPLLEERPDLEEGKKQLEARLGDPAVPLARAMNPSRVTSLGLLETARGAATNMAYGEPLSEATLAEGQRATMLVTIAPGACAAYVAQGGLGVIELDVFLTLADRASGLTVLAEDKAMGPIAVVGGHGRCHENTGKEPLAAELHVTVRKGAGPVLVRGYRRKK